jgi:hypothetical protein
MYILNHIFDFFTLYEYSMTPNHAAYIIQQAYRKHLIRKYFKILKQQTKTSSKWFFY